MTKSPQSFQGFIHEKKWELIIGLIISIVGFFLALSINSFQNRQAERSSFYDMIEAIKQEGEHNMDVLSHSFMEHFEHDIVVAEFSLSTLRASLANPLFMRYADYYTLQILNEYLRVLELSNGFAEATRLMRIGNNFNEQYLPQNEYIINDWRDNLNYCPTVIQNVLDINPI